MLAGFQGAQPGGKLRAFHGQSGLYGGASPQPCASSLQAHARSRQSSVCAQEFCFSLYVGQGKVPSEARERHWPPTGLSSSLRA